jgi:hypothetical protein
MQVTTVVRHRPMRRGCLDDSKIGVTDFARIW